MGIGPLAVVPARGQVPHRLHLIYYGDSGESLNDLVNVWALQENPGMGRWPSILAVVPV
jgi:hypothetical protein